jgi:twitching motility protein PilT
MDISRFFEYMVAQGASDLFLKTGSRPAMRVDGKIRFIADMPLTEDNMWEAFDKLLDETCKANFEEYGGADFSLNLPKIGRFRANIYRHTSQHGMVFRHVQSNIPSFEELSLPQACMQKLSNLSRGLVLATGIAGSGKSTTLASMLQYINEHHQKHIVTVEDPIEYVFPEKSCIFSQREVGIDTESFGAALRHAMRQSPDVILIGEMRDKETVEAALTAAETGHLVFSTLHTLNAVQTVERIVMFFPPYQHPMLRQQLAMVLEGVISLRLLRKKAGKGRVPAIELLLGTPTIKEILAEGRTLEMPKALENCSGQYGTMAFNQSLQGLFEKELVTLEDVMAASDNPDELKMRIGGIIKGTKTDTRASSKKA